MCAGMDLFLDPKHTVDQPPSQYKTHQNHPQALYPNTLTTTAKNTTCSVIQDIPHHQDSSPCIKLLKATDHSVSSIKTSQPCAMYLHPCLSYQLMCPHINNHMCIQEWHTDTVLWRANFWQTHKNRPSNLLQTCSYLR